MRILAAVACTLVAASVLAAEEPRPPKKAPGMAAADPAATASKTGPDGRPDSASLRDRAKKILGSDDPELAERALRDLPFLLDLNALDTRLAGELLAHAGALSGLRASVENAADHHVLRRVLESKFSQLGDLLITLSPVGLDDLDKFARWVERYLPSESARMWRQAVWDWETLTNAQRVWIQRSGLGEREWTQLKFLDRNSVMAGHAANMIAPLMAAARPLTEPELQKLSEIIHSYPVSKERVGDISERLAKLDRLRENLRKAKEKAGLVGSMTNRSLRRAQDESLTLEERALALADFFDHAGDRHQGAAIRAGERKARLDPDQLQTLGEMIGRSLDRKLVKALPGWKDYLADNPSRVWIKDLTPGACMLFEPQTDSFGVNRKMLESWLSGHGKTERDLLSDPNLIEEYVSVALPVFFHETSHRNSRSYLESAFGLSRRLPFFPHFQEDEILAMAHEAELTLLLAGNEEYRTLWRKPENAGYCISETIAQEFWSQPERIRKSALHELPGYAAFPNLAETAANYARSLQNMPPGSSQVLFAEDLIRTYPKIKRFYDSELRRIEGRVADWKDRSAKKKD